MKAVFEVKTIETDWAPPFKKNIRTEEYTASQDDEFDIISRNGNNEAIFKVVELGSDNAKLQFSSLFTKKTSQDAHTPGKIMMVSRGEEETIAYLWGEKGITKKVSYKGIKPTEMQDRFVQEEVKETPAPEPEPHPEEKPVEQEITMEETREEQPKEQVEIIPNIFEQ